MPRPTISKPSGCRSPPTGSSRPSRACSSARQGHALHHPRRPQDPRRHRGPVVRAMPATAARRSSRRCATRSASMDFAPAFQMGHPLAFELAIAAHDHAGRRFRPCVLHQLRLGVGRYRAEDRHRLSPRARPGHAHAADRARARLSRRRLRRHLRRRHRQQPQVLRHAAHRRGSPAAHPRPASENAFSKGQPELGRPSGRRARAHRRPARRLHHRRRDRRAGRRLDRRADPAEGLPAEAARDLHQARHPADLRRGHHRLRPPRRAASPPSISASCPT